MITGIVAIDRNKTKQLLLPNVKMGRLTLYMLTVDETHICVKDEVARSHSVAYMK